MITSSSMKTPHRASGKKPPASTAVQLLGHEWIGLRVSREYCNAEGVGSRRPKHGIGGPRHSRVELGPRENRRHH
ncbi:hypothetical protein FOZ60_015624 [Perkinsus olseni]|uniref:Uncharacterized protein n=1 Tax=Perkinsus olseni TaxID=32597 RepID=A0A7J6PKR5_PEROL|nr:hypothetical protein FOZ60_015624 [Perkinsus olseni]